jgi:large subunit ribosomal protein L10
MSRVSEEKMRTVDSAMKLLEDHEIIGAADLHKVGSSMLQSLRKQLREKVTIRGIKNNLMKIAMEKADLKGFEDFLDQIKGQNIYLFSNGNPFELAMTLHKNTVKVFAKEGEVAISDVVIPAGNTGLSPGPIISKFGNLGVRTRIEAGNIWVVQDTEVAKAGDVISSDLADLLTRLAMRTSEMSLEIKAIYENGTIIPRKDLILDLDSYINDLAKAYSDAFQVAVNAAYPISATMSTLLSLAAQNARKIALEAAYTTPDTATELITKSNAQALNLAKMVGMAQAKK